MSAIRTRARQISVLVAVTAVAATVAQTQTYAATTSLATLASDDVTFEAGDDGVLSASASLTNLTSQRLVVRATPTGGPRGCVLSPEPAALEGPVTTKVTFKLGGCSLPQATTLPFRLTATAPGSTPAVFDVEATRNRTGPSSWTPLWAFLVGLVAVSLVVYGRAREWVKANPDRSPVPADPAGWRNAPRCWLGLHPGSRWVRALGLHRELPHVGATWTFGESWAANVTAGGALLVGLLGNSDVLESVLGAEADGAVALTTVGAAISVAFVGAGALLATAGVNDENKPTVWGYLGAVVLTLTGAFGQVWVFAAAGVNSVDTALLQALIVLAAVASTGLLWLYTFRSVRTTLRKGSAAPEESSLADRPYKVEMAAALVAAAAARSRNGTLQPLTPDEIRTVLGEVEATVGQTKQARWIAPDVGRMSLMP